MHKGVRALLASVAALASVPCTAWLASELVAQYEMWSTNMQARAELTDDLGLGILLFMAVPPVVVLGFIYVWWFVWSRTGPKKNISNGDAHA